MRFSAVRAAIAALCLTAALCAQTEPASATGPVLQPGTIVAPPSFKTRGMVLLRRLTGPQAFVETLPGTAFDTIINFPSEWGRTIPGTAKRIGSHYGQFAVGEGIEFTVSALHREDPRYFPLREGGIWRRVGHAYKNAFITRRADGKGNTVNLSRLAASYGSFYVASRWSPEGVQDAKSVFLWGSLKLTTKTSANLLREFGPDLRKLFRRKKP